MFLVCHMCVKNLFSGSSYVPVLVLKSHTVSKCLFISQKEGTVKSVCYIIFPEISKNKQNLLINLDLKAT